MNNFCELPGRGQVSFAATHSVWATGASGRTDSGRFVADAKMVNDVAGIGEKHASLRPR